MLKIEDRGKMIIEDGVKVYKGMLIGINRSENDMEVNVIKGKKIKNIREEGKDEEVKIKKKIKMKMEREMQWIKDEEMVEVKKKQISIRKIYIDKNERKSFEKRKQQSDE